MESLPDLFAETSLQPSTELPSLDAPVPQKTKKRYGQNILVGCLVVGFAVSTGAIAYYGIGPLLAPPDNPKIISNAPDAAEVLGISDQPSIQDIYTDEEKKGILQKLSQHVQMPADMANTGVMGIIALPPKMEGFLAKARVGDAVIVFPSTQMAHLYRPSTDTLIATGSTAPQ